MTTTPKSYVAPGGAVVTMETNPINGMRTVLLRGANGEVVDKVRCDTCREALDYWKSFKKIARSSKP